MQGLLFACLVPFVLMAWAGMIKALSSGGSMQVANLEKWHPAQHVVTESLSGAIVTQKIVCHGPSHPKLPQPSPGKHTGVAEFIFNGEPPALTAVSPYPSLPCMITAEAPADMSICMTLNVLFLAIGIIPVMRTLEVLRSAMICGLEGWVLPCRSEVSQQQPDEATVAGICADAAHGRRPVCAVHGAHHRHVTAM